MVVQFVKQKFGFAPENGLNGGIHYWKLCPKLYLFHSVFVCFMPPKTDTVDSEIEVFFQKYLIDFQFWSSHQCAIGRLKYKTGVVEEVNSCI